MGRVDFMVISPRTQITLYILPLRFEISPLPYFDEAKATVYVVSSTIMSWGFFSD